MPSLRKGATGGGLVYSTEGRRMCPACRQPLSTCTCRAAAQAALGKRLRTACGSGGTVKDGVVELQGDHVERVIELLTIEGYKVKRAGG